MGRRVLIVDDEPYIRRILSFKLRREGFTTFEAPSAEAAEKLLGEKQVDLVLLDVALSTPTNGSDHSGLDENPVLQRISQEMGIG